MSELVEVNAETESPTDQVDDFQTRVDRLLEMMHDDDSVRDRMLCEIYLAFTDFERMTRTMAQNGGPIAMLKMMMGKG